MVRRGEDELKGAVEAQGGEEHDGGKQPPDGQVGGHAVLRGHQGGQSKFRDQDEGHQRKPEKAIGYKGGGAEGVVFLPFHDASNDLRQAAVKNAHRQDHAVQFVKPRVVEIQQHGSHAKAKQPKRRRIACCISKFDNGFIHGAASLPKERSTTQQHYRGADDLACRCGRAEIIVRVLAYD